MASADHWLLWQLTDSAFPAGGFGHSGGLEAPWQLGEIPARAAFENYLLSQIQQASRAALPFVLESHRHPERLEEIDQYCDVFLSNHVANRGSRQLGKSFVIAAEQSFPSKALSELRARSGAGHFAPMFGFVSRVLEVQSADAARSFMFIQLRGAMASAVRLGIIGPLEGQRIQFKLSPFAEQTVAASLNFTLDDAAHTAPLLDIWQGAHDRLYSRLFQT